MTSSMSAEWSRVAILTNRNPDRMGEEPLTQLTNVPDMDPDVGEYLGSMERAVAGHTEPDVAFEGGVSKINAL